jgi:hypothetical protein
MGDIGAARTTGYLDRLGGLFSWAVNYQN